MRLRVASYESCRASRCTQATYESTLSPTHLMQQLLAFVHPLLKSKSRGLVCRDLSWPRTGHSSPKKLKGVVLRDVGATSAHAHRLDHSVGIHRYSHRPPQHLKQVSTHFPLLCDLCRFSCNLWPHGPTNTNGQLWYRTCQATVTSGQTNLAEGTLCVCVQTRRLREPHAAGLDSASVGVDSVSSRRTMTSRASQSIATAQKKGSWLSCSEHRSGGRSSGSAGIQYAQVEHAC